MFAVYIGPRVHAYTRVRAAKRPSGDSKGYIHNYKAAARQEAICGRRNLQEFAAELSARARLNAHVYFTYTRAGATFLMAAAAAAPTKFSSRASCGRRGRRGRRAGRGRAEKRNDLLGNRTGRDGKPPRTAPHRTAHKHDDDDDDGRLSAERTQSFRRPAPARRLRDDRSLKPFVTLTVRNRYACDWVGVCFSLLLLLLLLLLNTLHAYTEKKPRVLYGFNEEKTAIYRACTL